MRTYITTLNRLSFLVLCICGAVYADKPCAPIYGEPSDCLKLNECPSLFKYIRMPVVPKDARDKMRNRHCGFEDNTPKVCCLRYHHKNLALLIDHECGRYDPFSIFRDEIADANEFPWLALLSYKIGNKRKFGCGGSLINKKYVLTAAHCIEKNLLGVRIGEHNITVKRNCQGSIGQCSKLVQDFKIEKTIVHENYESSTLNNDIALIRLEGSVNITGSNAGLICLPLYSDLRENDLQNSSLIVAGWGNTKSEKLSEVLQKISVSIVDNDICIPLHSHMTSKKLCAEHWGKDSRKGDSGGPLISAQKYEDKIAYVQYGIVAQGIGAKYGDEGQVVYTRVTEYIDWILNNLEP